MSSRLDENWRTENKSVSARLKVILRQQMFSDAVVVVQGKEFKCHRLILAVGSPYFERTFYHTFKNSDHHAPTTLALSDVTPEAFQSVLTFLYTDKVTFGNEAQAFQTYEAAEKFQILDLKSECEIYLYELEFRPKTIWNNLQHAIILNMEKMRRKCMTYIENNTRICLLDEAFLSAKSEVLMEIMRSEKLAVMEKDLLQRLAVWGKEKTRPYDSVKGVLKPYLCHIRFRALSPKEFCEFMEQCPGLLDSDDCLAILRHLELPHKNSLPNWCCRSPKRIWPY